MCTIPSNTPVSLYRISMGSRIAPTVIRNVFTRPCRPKMAIQA
jgi:hypothetical protein